MIQPCSLLDLSSCTETVNNFLLTIYFLISLNFHFPGEKDKNEQCYFTCKTVTTVHTVIYVNSGRHSDTL